MVKLTTLITGIGRFAILVIVVVPNWQFFPEGTHTWYLFAVGVFTALTYIDFKATGLYKGGG